MEQTEYYMGIDIGSTTVKIYIRQGENVVYSHYVRHHARQLLTVYHLLEEAEKVLPQNSQITTVICGSGGKNVAQALSIPYVQEVVANAAAIKKFYPQTRTAVELGGQDAKVIFFHYDKKNQCLETDDMRMNGSCAGGTGAFIDEIAKLLKVKPEEFENLAQQGTHIYNISGRCGVFAKTDIQPLLLRGAKREDIALSTLYAIVKQTIGGLAQGLAMKPPVIFEGGPLSFHPALVEAFAKTLHLSESEIIIPEHPEMMIAAGASVFAEDISRKERDIKTDLRTMKTGLKKLLRLQYMVPHQKQHPFFKSEEEQIEFLERHEKEKGKETEITACDGVLPVYIGIDSGSTTSKLVALDEEENIIYRYYESNEGKPLDVVKNGINSLKEKFSSRNIRIEVKGVGTTGYGEEMIAEAFGADYHVVETVAHARGCEKYIKNVSFILDIGGQDMKAIWLKDGVITNIMLNEACSAGCGSFLENFADSLYIPAEQIAQKAFQSEKPAKLGSRCTVFMNSTIINAQRDGSTPEDIVAGLCRSIIENVFTKVVRVSDKQELGEKIVVQGGTFKNMAVVKAIEDYLEKEVTVAPYPGEMGAIGVALLTKEHIKKNKIEKSSFIGFEKTKTFYYETGKTSFCNGCANHCNLTIVHFSTGQKWVTGNRCERGAGKTLKNSQAVNLFKIRENFLFHTYPYERIAKAKDCVIGIPRVLEFWDSMPFWTTFFRALGYTVKISDVNSQKIYEKGIPYVASDTICFPAKLVHGALINLEEKNVDRIFFPYVMHMPPEGKDKMSPYVCSVLQGYPMVARNSQDLDKSNKILYDTPVFHWFTEKNRKEQIIKYAVKELKATKAEAKKAYEYAEQAIQIFRKKLIEYAENVIEKTKKDGKTAVVLAGRPYHTDRFVNHHLAEMFTKNGIPVLTVDSLPEKEKTDLTNTRVEITNNFHTRMLEAAVIAAKTEGLEYVQIVSFGCGHDAVLSDEIIRIMKKISGKHPLILKIDESNTEGALHIRVQSFLKSLQIEKEKKSEKQITHELTSAYPVKFYRKDKKIRTLLLPNISENVSILLEGILQKEGFRVKCVDIGDEKQIALGKKYSHNDICFPCQMVIGELLDELQKGNYRQDEVAVGMVKFQCDCRMSHYAALLRKALDKAGFTEIPVLTTDMNDTKKAQPGVNLLGVSAVMEAVGTFMMLDILTEIARKIRPYECEKGETNQVLKQAVTEIAQAVQSGMRAAYQCYKKQLLKMKEISYDRTNLRPRCLVTGELLVTYHPGSNFHIEEYLEQNGMETIFPRITDQLRKDFLAAMSEIRDYHADMFPYPFAVDWLFDRVQEKMEKAAQIHPLFEKAQKPEKIYQGVSDIIPMTLSCGEGWLMAGEIAHYAKKGVRSFVILQPFGCLPNHVCGRGTIKRLKQKFPEVQILPLDLDPDTSYANIENRLQMLIMNNNNNFDKL